MRGVGVGVGRAVVLNELGSILSNFLNKIVFYLSSTVDSGVAAIISNTQ